MFRYPAKLVVLASMSGSALAGLGWDRLGRTGPASRSARRWCLAGAAVSVGLAVPILAGRAAIERWVESHVPAGSLYGPVDPARAVDQTLRALIQGGAVYAAGAALSVGAARLGRAGAGALILVTADLAMAGSRIVWTGPQSLFDATPRIAVLIEQAERAGPSPGPFRVHRVEQWHPDEFSRQRSLHRLSEVAAWERDTLDRLHAEPFGLAYTVIRGVIDIEDYLEFFEARATWGRDDRGIERPIYSFPRGGYDLWNTRYFVMPVGLNGWMGPERGFTRIAPPDEVVRDLDRARRWIDEQGWQLLRNDRAFPRCWVVASAVVVPPTASGSPARAAMVRELVAPSGAEGFDPRRMAFVETDDPRPLAALDRPPPAGPIGTATIVRADPQRVEIRAGLDSDGPGDPVGCSRSRLAAHDRRYPGPDLADQSPDARRLRVGGGPYARLYLSSRGVPGRCGHLDGRTARAGRPGVSGCDDRRTATRGRTIVGPTMLMRWSADRLGGAATAVRRVPLAALVCLTALVVACYGGVLFGGRQFAFRDSAHFYYPLQWRVQQEWSAGRLPLWEPGANGGQPMLGSPMAAVLYPGKLVFALVPYAWGIRLYTVGHEVLAFWAMFALMRHWGISRAGATVAGLSYAFGGPVLSDYFNIIYLVGAAWLPLGILAADRWIRLGRRRGLVELALVLAMQVLGGDPETAYLTMLCAVGYGVGLARSEAECTAPAIGGAPGSGGRGCRLDLGGPGPLSAGPRGRRTQGAIPPPVGLGRRARGLRGDPEGGPPRPARGHDPGPGGGRDPGPAAGGGAGAAGARAHGRQRAMGVGRAGGPLRVQPAPLSRRRVDLAPRLRRVHGRPSLLDADPAPGGAHRPSPLSLYVGALPIILALAAAGFRDGPPWRSWMTAVVLLSLWGSLGEFAGPSGWSAEVARMPAQRRATTASTAC